MVARKGWLVLASVAVVAAGCAWNDDVVFEKDPRIDALLKAGAAPHPFRLAVAPVKLVMDPEAEEQDGHFSPTIRPGELTARLVEAIKRLNLFREVIQVGQSRTALVAPGAEHDAYLTEAWEANADLLLEMDLSRYEVYWVGSNGLFIPNILWWSFAWAISGYVDDETYGGGIEINASLYSVHSDQKIDTWAIRKDVEVDLNDFERGWMLLGWLRVPGSLDEENWRKIGEVVNPRTELEVKVELANTFGESFKAVTGQPEFAGKMSKRLALLVGIDRWDDYRLNWTRFAGDDARAVEKALTDPEVGIGMPVKNLRTLVNERATLKEIKETIRGFLAKRATPEDLVILYFAGYGAVTADGKDGYLLAFDSKIDDLDKTALRLSELKKMLEPIKAKNVVVFLDTAFNSEEAMRSATKNAHSGAEITIDETLLGRLAGSGRVVTAASGPNEGAQLFAPKKHGMFTHFLLEGLDPKKRPADKNKDKAVTLGELLDYAKARTVAETELAAIPQTPEVYGTAKDKVFLVGEAPVVKPTREKPPEKGAEEGKPEEGEKKG